MNAARTMETRSALLTPDWITVRGATAVTSVTQSPEGWADMGGHADATFFVEVAQLTTVVGGLVLLQLETSPTPDESLFVPVAGPIALTPSATPTVLKTASAGLIKLARFVRWKVLSTSAGSWDVTFRLRTTCNKQTYWGPTLINDSGIRNVFWVRADLGLVINATSVTTWADQSGLNDAAKNLTSKNAAASPNNPLINIADASYAGQQTLNFTKNAGCCMTSGAWQQIGSPPFTWVLIGHRNTTGFKTYFIDGNSGVVNTDQSIFDTTPSVGNISVNAGMGITFNNDWNVAPAALLAEINGPQGTIYFNDFTNAKTSANDGANALRSLTVGSQNVATTGGQNFWSGTIAEIMGFNGILTSTHRSFLRTYLNNRYGLTIQ